MTSPSSAAGAASFSKPPDQLLHITTANNSGLPPASSITHSSTSSRSPRAGGGGQNQACAACKYQRRKCNPDCPLARYFPANQQRRFLNAHRLFGVSNIQKTLKNTDPEYQTDAIRALVFQSEARAFDPVGGCCRIVLELERQLHLLTSELAAVEHHLSLCRQQAAASASAANDPPLVDDPATAMLLAAAGGAAPDQDDVVVDVLYGAADQGNVDHAGGVQDPYVLADDQPQPHQLYEYFYYDGTPGDEASSHAWNNVDNVQHHFGNGDVAGIVKAKSPVALGEQLEQHCQNDAPFVDVFNLKETATAMQHDGDAGLGHAEEKVMAVVKTDVVDHKAPQIAESASASSRCHLFL